MKTGSHLLAQLERCGLSAQLAEDHREVSDDSSGARVTKQEIGRAWAAKDRAQTADAHTALQWLMATAATARNVYGVGEELDLVDSDGVVLVSGRPGAIIEQMDGEMLVVFWSIGDRFDAPEPEDDLGHLAMGLAVDIGKGFRVADVYVKNGEAICRRSNAFAPETHAALFDRIRQAANQPRDKACFGDWCGGCRQNVYCDAWKARAKTALVVFEKNLPASSNSKGVVEVSVAPDFELTSDNANEFALQIKLLKKALEMAEDLRNDYVRKGGVVIVDGKQMVMSPRDGRVTVNHKGLEDVVTALRIQAKVEKPLSPADLLSLAQQLEGLIKVGKPCDQPAWKNPASIRGGR